MTSLSQAQQSVSDMTDAEREAAIVRFGRAMEWYEAEYDRTSDFTDRAAADRARLDRDALIRLRTTA